MVENKSNVNEILPALGETGGHGRSLGRTRPRNHRAKCSPPTGGPCEELPSPRRSDPLTSGKAKPNQKGGRSPFEKKTRRGRRRAADISRPTCPQPAGRSSPRRGPAGVPPGGAICRGAARQRLLPPAARRRSPDGRGYPGTSPGGRGELRGTARSSGGVGGGASRALVPGTLLSCPRSPSPPLAAEMTESPVCFLLFNAVARTTVAPFQSLGAVAGGRRRRRSAGLPGRPRPRRFSASPDPARPRRAPSCRPGAARCRPASAPLLCPSPAPPPPGVCLQPLLGETATRVLF